MSGCHYETLGVALDATDAQIRQAYRRRALQCHPDRNGGDGSSTSNFVSSLIKSLPPVHEVAGMAGVELPDYLGSVEDRDDD